MTGRAILWDFDGTLATRPGLWSACVIEVLDTHAPGHGIERQQIGPLLESRFPWHDWETVHDHIVDPDSWWEPIVGLIAEAMTGVGLSAESAREMAVEFRQCFVDPARWRVYPDSVKALDRSASEGWRNVIVSNHVPELEELVTDLGLSDHVAAVVTSAVHGYEKPHPGAFRIALEAAGAPAEVWMVGDNPIADIAGAAQLGIPGILTRAPGIDPVVIQRLETSYGAARFPGWQQLCETRADTALEAVELNSAVNANPATQYGPEPVSPTATVGAPGTSVRCCRLDA